MPHLASAVCQAGSMNTRLDWDIFASSVGSPEFSKAAFKMSYELQCSAAPGLAMAGLLARWRFAKKFLLKGCAYGARDGAESATAAPRIHRHRHRDQLFAPCAS